MSRRRRSDKLNISHIFLYSNKDIRNLDITGMRKSRKSCAVVPREARRHTVSKFRKEVTMKISIETKKRQDKEDKVKKRTR